MGKHCIDLEQDTVKIKWTSTPCSQKMQKALHELRRNAQKKKTFGIERESI